MFTGAMLLLAIPAALFFFAPTWIAFHNRKREARWFAVFNVLARQAASARRDAVAGWKTLKNGRFSRAVKEP